MNASYKDILKATTLFGGVQGLNIVLGLVRTKFVAVLLGPEGVGLSSIYNETRELIHTATNCGMDQSGVRDISKAYEKLLGIKAETDKAKWQSELKRQITLLRSWEILLALLGVLVTVLLAQPLSLMTFQNSEHIWDFVMLSPAVGLSTIYCGEIVVLKSLRKLRTVALLTTLNVILSLLIGVPIYYKWGISGILPAILVMSLASTVASVYFSYRYSQTVLDWHWRELRLGIAMLKLGACFVVTGMVGHGMELLIMSHINGIADEVTVGLYRAGYTITGTYAALLFNAVSTDFFPRLSGVIDDVEKRNIAVCKQMEVLLMLAGPMTVALLVAMPLIVPLLYSSSFLGMVPMARVAVFGVLFGAIYVPAAYLPLAAGDTKAFLLVETINTVTMSIVMVGFTYFGLLGAGIGRSVSSAVDIVVVMSVAVFYYKIRMSRPHILLIATHVMILVVAYAITSVLEGWHYWVAGIIMLGISTYASWKIFRYNTLTQDV